jgi:uncharacterized protein YbjT (DUF2867 family)
MADLNGPVLVIGATGQQGGAVSRAVLARAREVHAFVRDAERPAARELRQAGARLVVGDLDDPASLRAAMRDVQAVFLVLTMMSGAAVTPAGVAAEQRRGRSVAEAAAHSGVAHLVYSSVAGARQHTGVPHLESKGRIEEHIEALGVPATVLRPVFFMENFLSLTRPAVVEGELVVNLGLRPDALLQLISTRDIGALAATALERPDDVVGRQVVIAGDILPAAAIADRFGAACGLPARFEQVPLERIRAFDEEVAKMFAWFDSGDSERADLPALRALHPELMTLAAWLRATAWRP